MIAEFVNFGHADKVEWSFFGKSGEFRSPGDEQAFFPRSVDLQSK